jgi:hydrogenase maturation factor
MTSEPSNDAGFSGFDLFLRFADGCRHYLEDRGHISEEDSNEIRIYLEERGVKPSEETIKRVYHVAYPGLQDVCKRLKCRSIFQRRVVREFYAFDHNRMKYEQGNLICIAYPARVMEAEPPSTADPKGTVCRVLLGLEPVTGMFRLGSDIPLKKGDWVIVHRMSIIEKTGKAFADRTIAYLRKLGLDKTRRFPRKAYKYLTGLKYSSGRKPE